MRKAWCTSALLFALLVPNAAAEIVVRDDAGYTLSFPGPVERIVTLAPHLAELVFDVGAGEKLVGTVEWSDVPEGAKRVPRIGDGFRIDVERIVALQPDIVLAWGGGTPQTTIAQLRALEIPVAVLAPRDLASIPRHLEWLGLVVGAESTGASRADAFRTELEALQREYSERSLLRVFFQVSAEPLFTVGAGHTISEFISICGGKNIFSDLDARAHSVSREAVIARNPQAIVAGQYAGSDTELSEWRQWDGLAAARDGNLFSIEAERLARPTRGILAGGRELCETLDRARKNSGTER